MFRARFEGGTFHNQPGRFAVLMSYVVMAASSTAPYELLRIEHELDEEGKLVNIAVYGVPR